MAALKAEGLELGDFVRILVRGCGGPIAPISPWGHSSRDDPVNEIRRTRATDIHPTLRLLEATGVFRASELRVAKEVLEEAATEASPEGYVSYTATEGDSVTGWICLGRAPCTEETYDLYWLAVHPAFKRQGTASNLIALAEDHARVAGGQLMVIETSARADHEPARRCYEQNGYELQATVPHFYDHGDAQLIYTKPLQPPADAY